jgi:hypothetical protein
MAKKIINKTIDEKPNRINLLYGLYFAVLPWLIIPALGYQIVLPAMIFYSAISSFFGLLIFSQFITEVKKKTIKIKTEKNAKDAELENEIEEKEKEKEEEDEINENENKNENDKDNANERETLIAKLLSKPDTDIQSLKKKLKKIFESRESSSITHEELHEQYLHFDKKLKNFLKNIKSEKDWDLPKNQKVRHALMLEAILFTDAVLARVENDIREDDEEVNAKNISKRLTSKENEEEGHAYYKYFLYRGAIDFYNILRAKKFRSDQARNQFAKYKSFYEKGTKDNDIRKLYNVTIKYGLENAYGGSKALRNALKKDDKILEEWTHKDSKKMKKFIPFPSKRPA